MENKQLNEQAERLEVGVAHIELPADLNRSTSGGCGANLQVPRGAHSFHSLG